MFPRTFVLTAVMALVLIPHRGSGPAPFLLADLPSAAVAAEDVVLTGRVLTGSGRPAEAAQVSISGGGYGALTTSDGRYTIRLGDAWVGREVTVRAQLLGYAEQRRTLTLGSGVNTVDFSLQQQAVALDEIVVTGQAVATKRRALGNTVSTLHVAPAPAGPPSADREAYAHVAENEFVAVATRPLSTFSIDVDRASYSNVRRFIAEGRRPPVDAVRIEELVNYFPYDDPAPADGEPFSVTAEVAQAPWQPLHQLVRIGLKGRGIDLDDAPANNLVFLIDVSGSMHAANKLPLLKTALGMLVDQLRPQDRVAIVVYAGEAGLVLPSTPGSERQTILDALESLEAGGSTAGGAGIHLAYSVAAAQHIEGGNNRVILATDGDFNVGPSSDGEMIRLIEQKREQGTFLTVLGFGTGNLQDAKMEQIADHGNGNFAYIDGPLEAKKVLVKEMGGTLVTIAEDVKIQVEFNPARVAAYRLIGYENRLLADEDFADDAKDAGELGAGHSVTALYEIVPVGVESPAEIRGVDPLRYQRDQARRPGAENEEILFVKLRYKEPTGDRSRLVTRAVDEVEADTSDDFRFAAAVAAWGMLLRDSEHCEELTLDDVVRMASGALGDDPEGYRADFVDLVSRARSMELLSQRVGMR